MTVVLAAFVAAAISATAWSVIRLHTDDLRQIARLTALDRRLLRDEAAICRAVREARLPDGNVTARLRC